MLAQCRSQQAALGAPVCAGAEDLPGETKAATQVSVSEPPSVVPKCPCRCDYRCLQGNFSESCFFTFQFVVR